MQEYDIYDDEGNVDPDKCQAIADEEAYQAWRDLPIDNPKLYAKICAEKGNGYKTNNQRKLHYKSKTRKTKPIFIAHW